MLRAFSGLIICLCFASSANAEDINSSNAQGEKCELHVWPSSGLKQTTASIWDNFQPGSGAISNGGGGYAIMTVPSATQRIERGQVPTHTVQPALDDPLTTSTQLDTLKSLPLADLYGVIGYVTIFHDEPLDPQFLRATSGRYLQTTNCYADLVISEVVYSQEAANGQNLKSFFRFRDFSVQQLPVRRLSTWVQSKLSKPRYGKKADIMANNSELPQAFAENARKFGAFLKGR